MLSKGIPLNYFQELHDSRFYIQEEADITFENQTEVVAVAESKTILSQAQKYKKALHVAQCLASRASEGGMRTFTSRMTLLHQIVDTWQLGKEVFISMQDMAYPNPASERLNVEVTEQLSKEGQDDAISKNIQNQRTSKTAYKDLIEQGTDIIDKKDNIGEAIAQQDSISSQQYAKLKDQLNIVTSARNRSQSIKNENKEHDIVEERCAESKIKHCANDIKGTYFEDSYKVKPQNKKRKREQDCIQQSLDTASSNHEMKKEKIKHVASERISNEKEELQLNVQKDAKDAKDLPSPHQQNDTAPFWEKVKDIKMPPKMTRRGRPKGAEVTVIGILKSKKKEV